VTVDCPPGQYATSGGALNAFVREGEDPAVILDGPLPASTASGEPPTGWQVRYLTGTKATEVFVTAICGVP
jgi:hypothetical protein